MKRKEISSSAPGLRMMTLRECHVDRPFPVTYLGFFSFIFFLLVFVYMYLCRPSEASTRYCVIPGGNPPQDWQSLPCAGE